MGVRSTVIRPIISHQSRTKSAHQSRASHCDRSSRVQKSYAGIPSPPDTALKHSAFGRDGALGEHLGHFFRVIFEREGRRRVSCRAQKGGRAREDLAPREGGNKMGRGHSATSFFYDLVIFEGFFVSGLNLDQTCGRWD